MTKARLSILLFTILSLLTLSALSQTRSKTDPIDKTGLLETLQDKVVRSQTLITQIRRRGVSFKMTPEDEEDIRASGKYLGKKGIEDLLVSIRNNYRPVASQEQAAKPNSMSQTMTNSPGSIQAGGDITINQGTWLMTRQEQIEITQVLKTHTPAKIHILMIGDSDARIYAKQIAYAIHEANWHLELVNYAIMVMGAYGVHIRMSDPELKDTVVRAFKAAGIPFIVDDKTDPEYPNAILVGQKP